MISYPSILQPIHDFLFVTECLHCGVRLNNGEQRVCNNCWNALSIVRENDYTFKVLIDRFREGRVIDDFVTLFYFEKGKLLQTLAHSLKYEEVATFGFELGVRLGKKISNKTIECIIPVPLNKRKERERGYNQSEWIAKGIASVITVPVLSNAVRRTRYTVTQTHLNAEERKKNIADAFEVTNADAVSRKNILLVDDIITTGSTIQEIARVLKNAKAARVIAGSAGLAKLGEDA
ncbi:MAG: phosphoribosyltransferase family protein [Bacteroidota bacterium]|nr:phosphoribosyltransferase family protein [Bacteroidota bacterium]